ncbi:BspA family leucine-rich repeat surface protein, partial [Thiomicrospira microaerophila]|uniref:BspA family leucine-rich repeat surface protein n=1 Tax=Thiomicrospira microaerophila TaxID=406020 RepID=UPI0006982CB8
MQTKNEVLFVMNNVEGYLDVHLRAPSDIRSFILNAAQPVLPQMLAILESIDQKVTGMHFISHGRDGEVDLGVSRLNSQTLEQKSDLLKAIGEQLSENGDILLYGCDIAKSGEGLAFISELSKITKADVAASNDPTGYKTNWILEEHIGQIDTQTLTDLVPHELFSDRFIDASYRFMESAVNVYEGVGNYIHNAVGGTVNFVATQFTKLTSILVDKAIDIAISMIDKGICSVNNIGNMSTNSMTISNNGSFFTIGVDQIFKMAESLGYGLTQLAGLSAEQRKGLVDSIVDTMYDFQDKLQAIQNEVGVWFTKTEEQFMTITANYFSSNANLSPYTSYYDTWQDLQKQDPLTAKTVSIATSTVPTMLETAMFVKLDLKKIIKKNSVNEIFQQLKAKLGENLKLDAATYEKVKKLLSSDQAADADEALALLKPSIVEAYGRDDGESYIKAFAKNTIAVLEDLFKYNRLEGFDINPGLMTEITELEARGINSDLVAKITKVLNEFTVERNCADVGVMAVFRTPNPESDKWIQQGVLMKPMDIKAKTLTDVDYFIAENYYKTIGAERFSDELVGLVAVFKPDASVNPDMLHAFMNYSGLEKKQALEILNKRIDSRNDEFNKPTNYIHGLDSSYYIEAATGLVKTKVSLYDKPANSIITADYDLWDIRDQHGDPISKSDLLSIAARLEEAGVIMHGGVSTFKGEHFLDANKTPAEMAKLREGLIWDGIDGNLITIDQHGRVLDAAATHKNFYSLDNKPDWTPQTPLPTFGAIKYDEDPTDQPYNIELLSNDIEVKTLGNDHEIKLTIQIDRPIEEDTVFYYVINPGESTLLANKHYQTNTGVVKFKAGEKSADVAIPILSPEGEKATHQASISLYAPRDMNIQPHHVIKTTVNLNYDTPNLLPSVEIRGTTVFEGDGDNDVYATLKVILSKPALSDTHIFYETRDITAKAGEDYVAQEDSLVIRKGGYIGEIKIKIIGDTVWEPTEAFLVRITDVNGALMPEGNKQYAPVVIIDNDILTEDIQSPAQLLTVTLGLPNKIILTFDKPMTLAFSLLDSFKLVNATKDERDIPNFLDYEIDKSHPEQVTITLSHNIKASEQIQLEYNLDESDRFFDFTGQEVLFFSPVSLGQLEEAVKVVTYLTVTIDQLLQAISNGSYAIEHKGIVYTFEDSAYNIDTSEITNMNSLFFNAIDFNLDIGYWDTSNVTDMGRMFGLASAFNQDIGKWNVSNVTNMDGMFNGATEFNQNIGDWDTSKVTNMGAMFWDAGSFNHSIADWDVSSVSNMSSMFRNASDFNQDISNWNVSNVKNMFAMFSHAKSFDQDISDWVVTQIKSLPSSFSSGSPLNDTPSYFPGWGKMPVVNNSIIVTEEALRAAIKNETYAIEQDGVRYTFENSDFNIDTSNITNMHRLFYFKSDFDLDISYWNTSNVTNMKEMFYGAKTFNQDIGNWNTSNVTDMNRMFSLAATFNQDIGNWNTSNVKDMRSIFSGATNFNQDISSWSLDLLTDMSYMFHNARDFNQDIGHWDVSSIDNMQGLFHGAQAFNQDIGHWDVSNVTNMRTMFQNAHSFNQDIEAWNTSKVSNMDGMFAGATSFNGDISSWRIPLIQHTPNQFDKINSWITTETYWHPRWGEEPITEPKIFLTVTEEQLRDAVKNESYAIEHNGITYTFDDTQYNIDTSKITDMSDLFNGKNTFNLDIRYWDTSSVTNMSNMFSLAESFQRDIGSWNTSNVANMSGMFAAARKFNKDIGQWDTSNVIDMSEMFYGANSFNQNIGSWDTSKVDNMSEMFFASRSFDQDIGSWNTSNVKTMSGMFGYTPFNQNIGNWNTSNVIDMSWMFSNARAFNQDIGNWDMSKIQTMNYMFDHASNFNQDIGSWNVSNVTKMDGVFYYATAFNQDIGDWNVSNVTTMGEMFAHASNFNQDIGYWDVSNVTFMDAIFRGAQSFNQNIGNWDVSNVSHISWALNGATQFDHDLSGWSLPKIEEDYGGFAENSPIENKPDFLPGWGKMLVLNNSLIVTNNALREAAKSETYAIEQDGILYTFEDSEYNIDTSQVTNMADLFRGSAENPNTFNGDIGYWNTANVTDMRWMFYEAEAFNHDIGGWDTSNVT